MYSQLKSVSQKEISTIDERNTVQQNKGKLKK